MPSCALHFDFLGLDQFGRPVSVERVGAWDVKVSLPPAMRGILMSHAIAIEACSGSGPTIAATPAGWSSSSTRGHQQPTAQPQAAEVAGSIAGNVAFLLICSLTYLVNAPTVFTAIGAVRPFVTNQTVGKVVLSRNAAAARQALELQKCCPSSLEGRAKIASI